MLWKSNSLMLSSSALIIWHKFNYIIYMHHACINEWGIKKSIMLWDTEDVYNILI